MKSQYPMTTHNHITSVLNIFKGRTGKWLMLFLLLLPALATAQETKKLIILQTSDVHSRIEPMTQEGDRNYGQGGFVRRASFLQQFRKENPDVLLFDWCIIRELIDFQPESRRTNIRLALEY